MTTESVDAKGVIGRLESARIPGPFALAFDADGTLWSGDVGEDTFEHVTAHGLVKDDARERLIDVARAHGLRTGGTASEIAASIFAGYLAGVVEEKLTCEVMTWAYAGHDERDLAALARTAFEHRGLRERARGSLRPIFEWARREGGFVMVISASPAIVVEAALEHAGIESDLLVASVAATDHGRILPHMAAPLPYGPAKRTEGERALRARGTAQWLGSFGDNGFDVEMLRAAHVGVAVHPKPALAAVLAELPNTIVFA